MTFGMWGLLISFPLMAQSNFVAIGASYQPGSIVCGSGMYSRLINANTGSWGFVYNDILPNYGSKPFTVQNNTAVGIGQRIATIQSLKGTEIYIPTSAGISWTGSNVGWSWTTGGMVSIPVGKFRLVPNIRLIKSSVGNNAYGLIGGVMIGIGF